MKKIIAIVAGCILASQAAYAQMGGGMGEAEFVIPDVDKESLILQRPDKWYPFYKESEQKVDTYYFPTGQSPEKWRETLQSQRYLSTLGVTEASQLFEIRTQANASACADHSVADVRHDSENGYSKSDWLETCVAADDSTVVTMNKSIVGNDQLYLVSKIWKYEPGDTDVEEWREYMSRVFVCDPTTESNPCRLPGGGRGAPPR